jgi:bifunctional DNase/RNase
MAYKGVKIDSVRYAQISRKWVTILKRIDRDEYFPIYMNASQANVVKRELIPGRFGDLWGYERFLTGKDITGYVLESLIIDEPDGNLRARLVFRKGDSIMETECPVAGAIALAFRRNARIFADEDSFYTTVSDTFLRALLTS